MTAPHHVLPAAAIPPRSDVVLDYGDGRLIPATVHKVHNADPDPGSIRWETSHGDFVIGGARRVIVHRLP